VPPAAAREIIDSLATIESCLNLFIDGERPLRERVAVSLARAEANRARWLAEACGVLGSEPCTRKGISPSGLGSARALQGARSRGRLST